MWSLWYLIIRMQSLQHTAHHRSHAFDSYLVIFLNSYPYFSGLLHWHWGNHMIAPVPVNQPWRIWVNVSCEAPWTTKSSMTKLCACFREFTVIQYNKFYCCHNLGFARVQSFWPLVHSILDLCPVIHSHVRYVPCKLYGVYGISILWVVTKCLQYICIYIYIYIYASGIWNTKGILICCLHSTTLVEGFYGGSLC